MQFQRLSLRLGLGFLFLFAIGCSSQESAESPVLRFSAIPDDNTSELNRKFQPVARYLSEQLGVEVEYVASADYGASVEMFKNGDIHLAWFGGLTGVQARQGVPGAKAIAQGVEDPKYFSYFIANTSSGLRFSESFPNEIAGRTFTFGSPKSTSGRLMPEHFIREATGKDPRSFFKKEFGFSGSHDKTIEQVAAGAYEVGAVSYRTYDAWVAEGKVDPANVQVIWKTPFYADYNFTAHPALEERFGEGFTARLTEVILEISDPDLLEAFRRTGFIPAKNEDFRAILEVARSLRMAR
ncbi:MAG: putative selenate ABC transporter substrate-binding protein [Candidatus Eisenbacteria bacterium]|uniref:Putative selenate ABC transporter substrate-binding protein n=1 Tax=Eiseniibacteriota bacterium TaxID=2212470 RepID=A0A7Y2EEI9_UNCEI|nr:putative selenate ABC transporter substrate-binding protein [Candidatus Eisenbacteria bacterium]